MNHRILITGASGLVGSALRLGFAAKGIDVRCLDIRASANAAGDVRELAQVRQAATGCHGIIHLAAVSRVVWGERDPELCWSTNVGGIRNVLEVAADSPQRPWVIFASSREVYGQPEQLPATEDTPVRPVNVYGRAKAEGERLVDEAQAKGLRAVTIRLSNVFGSTADHSDRVVPAFARAAVLNTPLRVDGADHTFDFTHIDDVCRGIMALAHLLQDGGIAPPPIHFVSGEPTTLGELAEMAIELAASNSSIQIAPPRDFDVARFFASPARAHQLLGWSPQVSVREGLARLVAAFQKETVVATEQAGA